MENFDPNNPSLATYFLQWYHAYKAHKITVRTQRWYQTTHRYLLEYFQSKPITTITRLDYQKFINWIGRNHSKETDKKVHAQIKACVRNAIYDDLIRKDFTQDISLTFDKTKTKQVQYLNMNELDKLIRYCTDKLGYRYPTRYLILTAIYTGARIGELLALTWEDVDFRKHTITINKSYNYLTHELQQTKTVSSNRVLRVNTACLSVLRELQGKL